MKKAENEKLGKLEKIGKGTKSLIPSSFDVSTHKTERSGAAVLMHWARNIIEENNIDLGLPDVETGGGDKNFRTRLSAKRAAAKMFFVFWNSSRPFGIRSRKMIPKNPLEKK